MATLVTTPEQNDADATITAEPAGTVGRRWSVGTLSYTLVGLCIVFGWLLLGDFVLNMKDRAISPTAMAMLRRFDAHDWLVGLLVGSIPQAIGLLIVPVISVKSDRFRSRWGRRIPFLLVPAPFLVLSMFGLAMTPDMGAWLYHRFGASGLSLQDARISVFALFWTATEIASVIGLALFGALVNDVVPQPLIGRFFGLFRVVSLIAGMIFNFFIIRYVDTHSKLLFASLGGLYGVGFCVMCLMVREGQYPPPSLQVTRSHYERLQAVISYLKECYGNPFFLCFFLATTLSGLAISPINTFQLFHARSVHMSDVLYGRCVGLSYFISLLLAYPLGILADRFHPVRLGVVVMAAYSLSMALGFFLARTADSFFVFLLLHTVISGCYFTATASIAQRLLPRAKFAEIASAGGMIGATLSMILPPSLGAFIGWMNHDYRYVFLLGCIGAGATCISYCVLLVQYNARGGDAGFTPPEEGPAKGTFRNGQDIETSG